MKKCYNFLMVLATVVLCLGVNFASAQEPILQEDFSALEASGSGTSVQCENHGTDIASSLSDYLPGWSGQYVYQANGKAKLGKSSAGGWLETPSIDLTDYESVRISFQAMVWSGTNDQTKVTVYVDTVEYVIENVPKTTEVECVPADFFLIVPGGREVTIRFEGHPRFFLDNVVIAPATSPLIEVQGTTTFNNVPANQQLSESLTVHGYNLTAGENTTVAISGDSQFAIETTSLSNDDLMGEEGVNLPFTFSAEEAGTYTATVSFSNSDLAEAVTVSLTVNVIATNEIATIAGLRALLDLSDVNANITDSVFYKYTGHAYVTQAFQSGSYTKWMQDETGAIQLYDPAGHLANVAEGMEITNVVGWLTNYFGYAEMNVKAGLANTDINAFPTNIPEPVTVTLAQLRDQTYMDGIQGQLVRMENVTFSQTGTFDRYGFYTITQEGSTDTVIYVTSNYDNIKGQEIPTGAKNILGVNMRTAAYSNGYNSDRLPSRYYIIPREFEEIAGISENGKTAYSVYPNPTSDNITLNISGEATHATLYNVMGMQVADQTVTVGANTVNMSQLPAGVYFLRIFNGNETTATLKVVRR